MQVQLHNRENGEHGSDRVFSVFPPGALAWCVFTQQPSCWGSHVVFSPWWSKLWHLPGAPKMQIALARCGTSTITGHKDIPIFVLRMKKQWHDSLIPDIQLFPRAIPVSLTADFWCLKLQIAGVVMVFKWVLPQHFLCLCQSPGREKLY